MCRKVSRYTPPRAPLSWGIARLCWKHAASIAAQAAMSLLSRYRGYRSHTVANGGFKRRQDCEVLFGKGPPDPTLESASPSPPQGSIWHRNRLKSGNWYRIDVESMPNRPLSRGGRGRFEGGVRGACAKKNLTTLRQREIKGGIQTWWFSGCFSSFTVLGGWITFELGPEKSNKQGNLDGGNSALEIGF